MGMKRRQLVLCVTWLLGTAAASGLLFLSNWGCRVDTQAPTPLLKQRTPGVVALKGFRVERLYTVPRSQGSWVSLTADTRDDKVRLIASDQYGLLYRVTLNPPGGGRVAVEPIRVNIPASGKSAGMSIGRAQGLLWAFDSLYVMANGGPGGSGLYRLRDTDGDDRLDEARLLRRLQGAGEHGPHAIVPSPDGKALYIVGGNGTRLPEIDRSRVPRVWAEDLLLPRQGYRAVRKAPGGWICRTDPSGKDWELICTGLRNPYDIAVNANGDLFTYDSDNERDVGTPWYRPTRVCHVVSGSEFGWRSGTGKWPAYYPDSLPPVVDVGIGSPTGITFGYKANFPPKYRNALYLLDWSHGAIYAVHLKPRGASYTGTVEKFIQGKPLPVTDVAIGADGAMYFTVGGRRLQSHLYRVTYVGDEPTGPFAPKRDRAEPDGRQARALRRKLETYHGRRDPRALDVAWPRLGSADRFIRYAARIAVEHQDVKEWQERALNERDAARLITALVALARHGDQSLRPRMLEALRRPTWAALSKQQQLELLRAYQLTFIRMGKPGRNAAGALAARLDAFYPAGSYAVNRELSRLLVYLEAPNVAEKTLDLQAQAKTQQEQIHYALVLRTLKRGWTIEQRRRYFRWFQAAQVFEGGKGVVNNPAKSRRIFKQVMRNIREDAITTLTTHERRALADLLEASAWPPEPIRPAGRGKFVRNWKVNELLPLVEKGLRKRNYERGRSMYREAQCIGCHLFAGQGTVIGPDLTGVGGRFGYRDLLESIIEPSKVVSDQYQAELIEKINGETVLGRVVAERAGKLIVSVDPLHPDKHIAVPLNKVKARRPVPVSMMPSGLLNTLSKKEVLDLVAYLLSGGNKADAVFK